MFKIRPAAAGSVVKIFVSFRGPRSSSSSLASLSSVKSVSIRVHPCLSVVKNLCDLCVLLRQFQLLVAASRLRVFALSSFDYFLGAGVAGGLFELAGKLVDSTGVLNLNAFVAGGAGVVAGAAGAGGRVVTGDL